MNHFIYLFFSFAERGPAASSRRAAGQSLQTPGPVKKVIKKKKNNNYCFFFFLLNVLKTRLSGQAGRSGGCAAEREKHVQRD